MFPCPLSRSPEATLKNVLLSLISVSKCASSSVGRLSKKSPTFKAFMTVVITMV